MLLLDPTPTPHLTFTSFFLFTQLYLHPIIPYQTSSSREPIISSFHPFTATSLPLHRGDVSLPHLFVFTNGVATIFGDACDGWSVDIWCDGATLLASFVVVQSWIWACTVSFKGRW